MCAGASVLQAGPEIHSLFHGQTLVEFPSFFYILSVKKILIKISPYFFTEINFPEYNDMFFHLSVTGSVCEIAAWLCGRG